MLNTKIWQDLIKLLNAKHLYLIDKNRINLS